jgi:hypothetical protein
MKSSIHLLYGIIIGILVMFCVGQKQEGKKEYDIKEIVVWQKKYSNKDLNTWIADYWKKGWKILEWKIEDDAHFFFIGK